jgi:hypothetical protein
VHFAPSNTPTVDFPPPDYSASRFGWLNKLKYAHRNMAIAMAVLKCGIAKQDEAFRRDTLGLDKLNLGAIVSDLEREPSLHAYSALLQPKPADWPDWVFVLGAFVLREDAVQAGIRVGPESAEIAAFMARAEDKPVYVGFGSMEGTRDVMVNFVRAAVQRVRRRVVLCCSKALYVQVAAQLPEDCLASVLHVHDVPHSYLFPQCACIVHRHDRGSPRGWSAQRHRAGAEVVRPAVLGPSRGPLASGRGGSSSRRDGARMRAFVAERPGPGNGAAGSGAPLFPRSQRRGSGRAPAGAGFEVNAFIAYHVGRSELCF